MKIVVLSWLPLIFFGIQDKTYELNIVPIASVPQLITKSLGINGEQTDIPGKKLDTKCPARTIAFRALQPSAFHNLASVVDLGRSRMGLLLFLRSPIFLDCDLLCRQLARP